MSDPRITIASEGHTIVDCSANPFDVRPYVGAIMDRANFLYRENGKPTVILMGETHAVGTHMAALQILLKRVREKSFRKGLKSAFGIEVPYDHFWSHDLPEKEGFSTRERDGYFFCKSMAEQENSDLPSSDIRKNLFASLMIQGVRNVSHISTALNDAVMITGGNDDGCLFVGSNITEQAIKNLMGNDFDLTQGIHPASEGGLAIRNVVIVKNMLRHLRETQTRLYVQHCGITHVKGRMHSNGVDEAAHKDSLEGRLLQTGEVNVVSAFASHTDYNDVPENGRAENAQGTVVAEGLN